MKILATSDIHGNKALIYLVRKIVKKENIDALIIAGDIAPKGFYQLCKDGLKYDIQSVFSLKNREGILKGDEHKVKAKLDLLGFVEIPKDDYNLSTIKSKQKEKLSEICKLLKTINIPVYMLIGNDDHISDENWDEILSSCGIFNLNLSSHVLGKLKMVGFQYVLPTPWNTNNELPEDKLADKLKRIEEQVDRKTILITHGPPKGTLDRLTNGLRAGSVSIFNLVKDKQPIFHIFGHIHEAFGNTKISNTTCCNASCLWTDWLLRGYIIDTKDESIKKIKEEINFKRRYGL
ncbi:MAG: metallophosphoesterase, partial [Candidatus Omnitrophica bacterium]|nr:metallophosphoesterase [Candidatus Omnitrophota bacterium]